MFALGVISYSSTTVTTPTNGFFTGTRSTSSGLPSNVINNLVFASETDSALGATLPNAEAFFAGTVSTAKGYVMGGNTNGSVANNTIIIQALTFPGHTTSTISSTLPTANAVACAGQSASKGYNIGGLNSSGTGLSSIQAITFSGETTATLGSSLAAARADAAGSSSASKVYVSGGSTTGGFGSDSTTIYSLTFSGETTGTVTATLPTSVMGASQGSFSSSKGYVIAGASGGNTIKSIQALTFSGETTASLSATLSANRARMGSANSGTKTYTAGGTLTTNLNAGDGRNIIESLDFSGETNSVLSATLTVSGTQPSGLSGT